MHSTVGGGDDTPQVLRYIYIYIYIYVYVYLIRNIEREGETGMCRTLRNSICDCFPLVVLDGKPVARSLE